MNEIRNFSFKKASREFGVFHQRLRYGIGR